MKELLEKIKKMRRVPTDLEVEKFIEKLGDDFSINLLEAALAYYKREEKRILSEDLLEWMNENDQISFENEDVKVGIKTYVSSKVLDPEKAFPWLISNQYGDLIKDSLEFPKGELTSDAEKALENMGLSYKKTSGIHPQTLKKVISDRLSAGEDLPDEENGIKVSYYDECTVKEK